MKQLNIGLGEQKTLTEPLLMMKQLIKLLNSG